ncbi:MAG: glycosyltransferase family 9 protein [Thermodesulfobacteriota bacterium]
MRVNILVIRWSGMGDIIMTLPAVKWLKEHFPGCRITYLTDIAFAAIPEKSGVVDRIEPIDRRGFSSGKRFLSAAAGTLATVFRLRSSTFNMAFDLQGFGETALLALLSGAPIRVGRVKDSPLRRRIYTRPIEADWAVEHRSRYFVRAVAEACGASAPPVIDPPELKAGPGPENSSRSYIGLNIGASTESRRWSERYFIELAERLSGRGYDIRFFLGPQEEFLADIIRPVCLQNHWDFTRHNHMEPLMETIGACRLLVSNDTGPGHLAAALGIPVITLFSTGDPENVRPLAKSSRWFRNASEINRIAVSEVEEACLELLKPRKD